MPSTASIGKAITTYFTVTRRLPRSVLSSARWRSSVPPMNGCWALKRYSWCTISHTAFAITMTDTTTQRTSPGPAIVAADRCRSDGDERNRARPRLTVLVPPGACPETCILFIGAPGTRCSAG